MLAQSHKRPHTPTKEDMPNKRAKTAELLKNATLADVLKQKRDAIDGKHHVVVLYHNSRVKEAMETMAHNSILAVPVLAEDSIEDNEGGVYLGFVDVLSVLHSIMREIRSPDDSKDGWIRLKTFHEKDFGNHLLITVTSGSDAGFAFRGFEGQSLENVVKSAFLHDSTTGAFVHRVAIFNGRGHIVNIVSQSDIVRYLNANYDRLGSVVNKTIGDLGFAPRDVLVVKEDDLTADACDLMDRKHIAAVGVVDGDGRLVNNFSASDLRGLRTGQIGTHLQMSVKEFLEYSPLHKRKMDAHNKPLTVKSTDKFGDVLRKIVVAGVHRLYVTDDAERPVGLVSLTDILRAVVETPEEIRHDLDEQNTAVEARGEEQVELEQRAHAHAAGHGKSE
eukprot:Opistho-2@7014